MDQFKKMEEKLAAENPEQAKHIKEVLAQVKSGKVDPAKTMAPRPTPPKMYAFQPMFGGVFNMPLHPGQSADAAACKMVESSIARFGFRMPVKALGEVA